MGKSLVIVESPTKARTIRNFLPKEYTVMSSMGHVRDLPTSADEIPAKVKGEEWAQLGVNVRDKFEPLYVVPKSKKKVVKELKDALKDADEILLATDEDREGESISWHLLQLLKPTVPVKRMVFHEITKEAIAEALADTRDVDEQLVRAQETRRILDRLVGYTVSPLLWKKIGGNLSAGRVQSVAVRLLVMRERERRAFKQGSYWDLKAELVHPEGADDAVRFPAVLHALDGTRVAKGRDFDENTGQIKEGADVVLVDEERARKLQQDLVGAEWTVEGVEEKPQTRKPAPPFITSTLQQEANRKLNLSAQQTMRVAQDLYQRGFITYMRTDSVNLSQQAITAARAWVEEEYGKDYLSPKPRRYSSSTRGAQEAHEAIRPSGGRFKSPQETGLSGVERKLYELIWKRTVASQMADSKQTNLTATLTAGPAEFRATGKRIDFPGFIRAYVEGSDDPDAALGNQEFLLPDMARGEHPKCLEVEAVGHETKPPARYTEATLVRTLEREGVGRPSTYATIIQTIQDRGYCFVDKKALVPTYKAFAVAQLLERHFPHLVDLGFTAEMERTLDEIAEGKVEWLPYLESFYLGDKGLEAQVAERQTEIEPESARRIAMDGLPAQVRIGRFGPYVETEHEGETVRATIPDEIPPGDLDEAAVQTLIKRKEKADEPLYTDPETGENVYVLTGRYGPFVQRGEAVKGGPKPKRVSLPKGVQMEDVDEAMAKGLLGLPRNLGSHPEGGKVMAGLGRFGPYVVHDVPDGGKDFRSLKAGDDVLTVDLKRALELLAEPKKGGRGGGQKTLKELGEHPEDKKPVRILDGRYGPYVKHASTNASLPKGMDPETVTMDKAVELLAERAAKKKSKGGRKKKS